MSIIKRKAGSKDIVKSVLEFDEVPTEGSHNLVESGSVAQAIGNLGQPLQWKGPATVAALNAGITGIQPGWTYTLTDAGTLTDGNVKVEAGDEVAWTEDDEWFQVGPSLVELKADVVQAKSDIADIQDVVPEEASESNKLVTKDELDNVQESIQSGFTPKGEISVSDLNDLTTQSNGDQYILTDSGTITDGSVTVEAGDSVAWNSTDSVWYKVNQYALSKYGTDEIKNLPTTITSFRTGDVIPVDGPSGTAKMSKDDLLQLTAQNALVDAVALKTSASTDCNAYLDNGIFNVETTFSNVPSEMVQNGVLLCFSSGTYRKVQVIVEYPVQANLNKRMWVRIRSGSSWTSWENLTTKQYVDDLVNGLDTKIFSAITYPNKSLPFGELPNVQTLLNTNTEPETSVGRFVAYDLGTYNSFYFYAQTDVEVYFDDDVIESANYLSIMWGVNPNGTWVPVSGSTANRRYIQCSSVTRKRKSNNDLPTSNSRLTIPAGSIIAFTQRNTDSARVNINCYPELSPSLPASGQKKMKITYESSDLYKISFGDYECELYRVVNAAADADNWNVVHISHNGNDIIGRWTDIIGPLKLSGDSDFIGGVHGSETTNSLFVYAGSKKLTLDSSLDEEFEKLTIVMNSTCRRASDQSNAFNRRVCVEITKNKMHISSEFVCIASSSLTVTRVTNGGLISANNNVILGCYMNNYSCDGYPLAAPNNQSKNNTHAVIVTTQGTIIVNNLQGKEQTDYKGYFELFATEEVPRTKVYFCPLYGTEKSVSAGDSFYGECEYIFEP